MLSLNNLTMPNIVDNPVLLSLLYFDISVEFIRLLGLIPENYDDGRSGILDPVDPTLRGKNLLKSRFECNFRFHKRNPQAHTHRVFVESGKVIFENKLSNQPSAEFPVFKLYRFVKLNRVNYVAVAFFSTTGGGGAGGGGYNGGQQKGISHTMILNDAVLTLSQRNPNNELVIERHSLDTSILPSDLQVKIVPCLVGSFANMMQVKMENSVRRYLFFSTAICKKIFNDLIK